MSSSEEWNAGLALGLMMLIFIPSQRITFGLVGMMFGGLTRNSVDTKTKPNQGIHLSFKNSIIAGSIFVLAFGFLTICESSDVSTLLTRGSIFGLSAALWYGGIDIIKHYILRSILYRNDYSPFNYARFLNHATDRLLLRRVGGGYIFIHRYLLEYLAGRQRIEERTGGWNY